MKTKHKILLAKAAYHAVHAGRAVLGNHDRCVVSRSGTNYELDISQGIDFSIFLLGNFEPGTSRVLQQLIRPGFVVIDVGANIGAHALNMARWVGPSGRVIACEPTDFAFRKLARNLELNPELHSRVLLLQRFLGPSAGWEVPKSIYSRWPLVGGTDLHAKHLGNKETTGSAEATSLDALVRDLDLPKVDLVKLDVDGFECDVLAGANDLLKNYRPMFVMELAPYVLSERGCSLSTILRIFQDNGYELMDESSMAALPMDPEKLEAMIGEDASKNVIARPKPGSAKPALPGGVA